MSDIIFHLALPEDAEALSASGVYRAPSLGTEGFIHCASDTQLPGVIQRYYANAEQLVLLHIDPDQMKADLIMENTVGGEELFPHIYSAIAASAIVDMETLASHQLSEIAKLTAYRLKKE